MAVSKVITFGGAPDDLVWKYPDEDIPSSSTVIVDETHKVLIIVNGQAADLLEPGAHRLDLPSLPVAGEQVRMATGGDDPFPCKVFYISQVHQSNLLWGTQGGPIVVDDPLYRILIHVMMHGSLYYSVTDPRKLLLKLVGLRDRFGAEEVTEKFRGMISVYVKHVVSQIMIKGGLSFFVISAEMMELSQIVKEQLDVIFDEYGIGIEYFNIETIEVPDADFADVSAAKLRAASRLVEGHTWQQEREMLILEKFAENPAAANSMLAMGTSFGQIARMAVGSAAAAMPQMPVPPAPVPSAPPAPAAGVTCRACGKTLGAGSRFCNFCGARVETEPVCASCGVTLTPGSKFCNQCGTPVG